LIEHSVKDGKLTFRVQVVPRASRSEVVGEHNGALRVRIAASPVEGAANDELVRTLAKTFSVPTSAVKIVRGQTSKLKTVSVTGLSQTDFLDGSNR
jgi:uncharacterized protein (TIGR00251 family)